LAANFRAHPLRLDRISLQFQYEGDFVATKPVYDGMGRTSALKKRPATEAPSHTIRNVGGSGFTVRRRKTRTNRTDAALVSAIRRGGCSDGPSERNEVPLIHRFGSSTGAQAAV
jgi:hypothetical protein